MIFDSNKILLSKRSLYLVLTYSDLLCFTGIFRYIFLKQFSRSFKDAIDDPSASIDGDDTPTIEDIPGSITLWEASPRPTNSADVNKTLFIVIRLRVFNAFVGNLKAGKFTGRI